MASPPTVEEFLVQFPEFSGAGSPLIQAKLDLAAARTDAEAWGETYALGIMQRAADLLAKTPEGRRMRLVDKTGVSIYGPDLDKMVRRASYGRGRVT